MSMNIAPQITQTVVNAAAPSTESLAHANAKREVVPAPVHVEAAVPQKSREQDTRGPAQENPTYDNITQKSESSVIPDDPLAEDEGREPEQEGEQAQQKEDENSETSDDKQTTEASDDRAKERAEQAVQEAERREIQQLERRDDEVRAHEQAHAAVGGGYAGTPNYQYETGPNGQKYAVAGEVSIDVSKEGSPQETIQKMQTVRAAALAPAEPSSQDRKVAAEASQQILEARAELIRENSDGLKTSDSVDEVEDDFELNTDSHVSEEPRLRSLSGAQEADPVVTVSETKILAEDASPVESRESQANREGQVIQNRYIQSYRTESSNFSAVA